MTIAELLEWEALYAAQPFGPALVDAHFAQLCAVIVNMTPRKGGRRAKAKDFMMGEVMETPEQRVARFKATIAGAGKSR